MSAVTRTLLNAPTDVLGVVASFLSGVDYTSLVASHRSMRHLRDVAYIKQNSVFNTMRLLELVVNGRQNTMLTGEAGVGKTYTVKKLVAALQRRNLSVRMTASTGAACAAYASIKNDSARVDDDAVPCTTVHSFSGLGKGTTPLDAMEEAFSSYSAKHHGSISPKLRHWRTCDVLIIDEISMIGARLLAKLDLCARRALGRDEPFGGVQVVFVGDWLQMSPVADMFCFTSPIWESLCIQHVYLTHVYRQAGDVAYARMLKRIRTGDQTPLDVERLQGKVVDSYRHDPTTGTHQPVRLEALNENVRRINDEEFARNTEPISVTRPANDVLVRRVLVPGSTAIFEPTTEITLAVALAAVGRYVEMRAPSVVELKENAQYILTRNISVAESQTNGATCTFRTTRPAGAAPAPEFGGLSGFLVFANGSYLDVDDTLTVLTQTVFGHANIFLRRKQYAIRLGYACTFHSSQGMTFDRVIVNLASVRFAAAAYTGLSRVKSFAGLTLIGFQPTSIRTHAGAKAECMRLVSEIATATQKRQRHAANLVSDRDAADEPAPKRTKRSQLAAAKAQAKAAAKQAALDAKAATHASRLAARVIERAAALHAHKLALARSKPHTHSAAYKLASASAKASRNSFAL